MRNIYEGHEHRVCDTRCGEQQNGRQWTRHEPKGRGKYVIADIYIESGGWRASELAIRELVKWQWVTNDERVVAGWAHKHCIKGRDDYRIWNPGEMKMTWWLGSKTKGQN
jgi:hypothetical protein